MSPEKNDALKLAVSRPAVPALSKSLPKLSQKTNRAKFRFYVLAALKSVEKTQADFISHLADFDSSINRRQFERMMGFKKSPPKVGHVWIIGQELARFGVSWSSGPFAIAVCECDQHLLGMLGPLIETEKESHAYGVLLDGAPYSIFVKALLDPELWQHEIAAELPFLEAYREQSYSLHVEEEPIAVDLIHEATLLDWLRLCRNRVAKRTTPYARRLKAEAGRASAVAEKMLPLALRNLEVTRSPTFHNLDEAWLKWSFGKGSEHLSEVILDNVVALNALDPKLQYARLAVWSYIDRYRNYKVSENEQTPAYLARKKVEADQSE